MLCTCVPQAAIVCPHAAQHPCAPCGARLYCRLPFLPSLFKLSSAQHRLLRRPLASPAARARSSATSRAMCTTIPPREWLIRRCGGPLYHARRATYQKTRRKRQTQRHKAAGVPGAASPLQRESPHCPLFVRVRTGGPIYLHVPQCRPLVVRARTRDLPICARRCVGAHMQCPQGLYFPVRMD